MEIIIESESQLKALLKYKEEKCFIGIIPDNDYYHPVLADTVAVYLRPSSTSIGYIIPLGHTEGLNLEKSKVFPVLYQFINLYTLNRKESFYHGFTHDLTDVSLLASLLDSRKLEINCPIPILDLFYRYHREYKGVNRLIPLLKLHEKYEHLFNSIKSYLEKPIPDYFDFYNNDLLKILYLIENQGIGVNKSFLEVYNLPNPRYNINRGKIFTSFNPYNHTTRPSNAFNTVNFAAIPKTQEYRKAFTPTRDFFVQFDFDSYHLRLVSDLIGYTLTKESGHKQLAQQYFKEETLTDEMYSRAKQINFEAIYGRIPEEYKNVEFFVKLRQGIDKLWEHYKTEGYVIDPISGREIKPNGDTTHPTKLLNYFIQGYETSRNIKVLKKVIQYLSNKKSKVVHYIYDAVILDYSKEDGKEVLTVVQELLSENEKYPVKFSYGKDLYL